LLFNLSRTTETTPALVLAFLFGHIGNMLGKVSFEEEAFQVMYSSMMANKGQCYFFIYKNLKEYTWD